MLCAPNWFAGPMVLDIPLLCSFKFAAQVNWNCVFVCLQFNLQAHCNHNYHNHCSTCHHHQLLLLRSNEKKTIIELNHPNQKPCHILKVANQMLFGYLHIGWISICKGKLIIFSCSHPCNTTTVDAFQSWMPFFVVDGWCILACYLPLHPIWLIRTSEFCQLGLVLKIFAILTSFWSLSDPYFFERWG